MKLPPGDQAVVDIDKLRYYCLSPTHPRGRHKARVFASALGLRQSEAAELKSALLTAARTEEAVPGDVDAYGTRYAIDFIVRREKGGAWVRSLWLLGLGEFAPRFITCYVLRSA